MKPLAGTTRAAAIALTAAWLALGGAAEAGQRTTVPVFIDTVNRWAEGSLGSARNSTDLVQYIGCHTVGDAAVPHSTTQCWAQNSAGVVVSCTFRNVAGSTLSPSFGVPILSNNAYLSFSWDANGNCDDFYVEALSRYEPKKP